MNALQKCSAHFGKGLEQVFRQQVLGPYHCSHSLHGLILLVHVELSQVVGHRTFILELGAQPLISLRLVWTTKGPSWVSHHPHLERTKCIMIKAKVSKTSITTQQLYIWLLTMASLCFLNGNNAVFL